MFETMMLNRINESTTPETSCCRQLLNKSETKKYVNLRRKRMELRKMRSVAKEIFYGDQSSGSSEENEDCPHVKRRKEKALNSDNTYDEENMVENEAEVVNRRRVASHGKISVIGRRREMEDAVAVELDFLKRGEKSYNFYGVYDGHGGWRVAEECRERMHKVVGEVLGGEENESEVINWEKVMVEGFRIMDEEVNKKGAAVATTGSTAVVAVVNEEEIIVANCGDSRAVMRRGGAVVPLSDDHKPDRADELERIEGCGGKVINWNGQRVLGVLATSRSIGDKYLKPYVITNPEVKVIKRSDLDEFIILASDGLWDVISNEVACQVTRRCLDGQIKGSSSNNGTNTASQAAAVLAELAMARGSRDNISVVVVDLKRGQVPFLVGSEREAS